MDPEFLKQVERAKEAAELREVSSDISGTYLWVLCSFGIPGNILTIITILTLGKMTPAIFFVALLGACDGCALTSKLIGHLLHRHDVYLGDAGCKLQFIAPFLSTMANWTLALIALERFFSVCYPLQKMYLFTKRRSYMIATIIFITLLTIFAVVFGVLYESLQMGRQCGVKKEYIFHYTTIWYWINACLFLFLPFLFNICLTILIVRGLINSRRERRSIFIKDDSGKKDPKDNNRKLIRETERAERMITIMLILASILFLVLALPACVYTLTKPQDEKDALLAARWELFEQIQFVLFDSTHAINFFLYFISAKRFRNHFISLMTGKRWPRAKSRDLGTSHGTESSKLSTTQLNTNGVNNRIEESIVQDNTEC